MTEEGQPTTTARIREGGAGKVAEGGAAGEGHPDYTAAATAAAEAASYPDRRQADIQGQHNITNLSRAVDFAGSKRIAVEDCSESESEEEDGVEGHTAGSWLAGSQRIAVEDCSESESEEEAEVDTGSGGATHSVVLSAEAVGTPPRVPRPWTKSVHIGLDRSAYHGTPHEGPPGRPRTHGRRAQVEALKAEGNALFSAMNFGAAAQVPHGARRAHACRAFAVARR
jgi:hypothetical protein